MTHDHAHGGEGGTEVSSRTRRRLAVAAVALAVLTAVGAVILRPTGKDRPDLGRIGVSSELYEARVVASEEAPCSGTRPQDAVVCDFITIELKEGPDRGGTDTLEIPLGAASPNLGEEDQIVVTPTGADQGPAYEFADRQRRPVLIGLAVLFALVVVVLGRLRGLAALGGLAGSLAILLTFVLPSIIDGRSPVLVAIVGSSAIAFLALYMAHGFTPMTTVALIGTLAALALTAVLAMLFVALANFSGFATEEAFFLEAAGGQIDLAGLMLAGVVIGALGALDDMTVTQASAVWELRGADPEMPTAELYAAGIRIGRDHVASTVNTLLLAYAGASMPLLLLFVLSAQSLGTVANAEVVATEIVRTLIGSIGLVSAVPLTTWLAATVLPPRGERGAGEKEE
ncbi:MAG: YibE/F family protein [Actinobacteria bacterium]|nr:YibE/F family protein [Actinomycetota bacterium]